MPAALTSVVSSRGRCLSARNRRMLPHSSRECWLDSSKKICSGLAFTVLLQLSGTGDCARIHDMDSDSLSSFMQSLKGISAPDPRSERPVESKPAAEIQATGTSRKAKAASAPDPVEARPEAAPTVQAANATAQQYKPDVAQEPHAVPKPDEAAPEPTYSIFKDPTVPSSSSQPDDLTAQLLGLRSSQDSSQQPFPRQDTVSTDSDRPQEGWIGILGLPLAVWTTLDKVLPPELRATSGEPLTEEVQRAVYVVKGLVLVASSALAYFLSRALLAQLTRTLQGFPLVQQAVRAIEAAAAATQQAQPELQQRASALLDRLPGRSTGQRERNGAAAWAGPATVGAAEQSGATRGPPTGESATNMFQGDGQRDGGAGGAHDAVDMAPLGKSVRPASAGASPRPPPLVPTASGALYAMSQGVQYGPAGVQRRQRLADSERTAVGTSGNDVAVRDAGRTDEVPLPVIDEVDVVDPAAFPGRVQRRGVLWERGSGRQASLLSSRWVAEGEGSAGGQGASTPAAVGGGAGQQKEGGTRSPRESDITFRGAPGATGGDTGSHMDVESEGDRMQSEHAHVDSNLGKVAGEAGIANTAQVSGSGRDPWFG